MAYNEQLSKRIEASLRYFPKDISEAMTQKKMFGGIVFLYKGKMAIGVIKQDLMVRVISAKMDETMKKEAVRPMDFTKKPIKEYIYVGAKGIKTEEELQFYIELGLEHALTKV
ncbi:MULTISPECIES: TfoX/Sxy family protein [unclassified Cellulophaga]|uniref:TfoX/Sxy family protein n=1 Tax=unclassified Cellulophaga TaxID=2634405 RepID=UPI001C4FD9A8|nr:TfoX/Sxy family protein [Cellulophaga sp. HaHa_2_1]QXP52412.1 TfoX/Sxy family protein [Cellulophaga sp. HaHa_2_1]